MTLPKASAWRALAGPQGREGDHYILHEAYEVDDDEAEDGRKTIRVLKHYPLFYASQVDGISAYKASTVEEAS